MSSASVNAKVRRRRVSRLPMTLVLLGCLVTPAGAAAQTVLVEQGSPLRLLANDADPGIALAWTAQPFDDSTWTSGTYGIGYETGTGAGSLIATTVPDGTASVYTRAPFDVADVASIQRVLLGVDYDDGVVAWVNGTEVWRSPSMPAGGPAWDTESASHESTNAAAPTYTPLVDVTARALPVLHAGRNVLAIGAWNDVLPSSDLVLVPRLSTNDPPTIVRGPYLQSASPTRVIVRWRTNAPADGVVALGASPANLTRFVTDGSLGTEHEVEVTGLTPGTLTYYSVGTTAGTLAGGDANHYIVTPPVSGTLQPTRAWILGDSGTADANARAVRDAYLAFAGSSRADMVLMLGDNAYDSGTDAEMQGAVFDTYGQVLRNTVLWPTFGNHDGRSSSSLTQSGPYYEAFTLPIAGQCGGVPSGTEAYYSFDHANIHFVCLDSFDTDRSGAGAMMTWLRQDVAATSRDWVVAFWHHPPYSKGSHDSDSATELMAMRQEAVPILEDAGVDLVLGGHSHSYERSFLIDGHYGLSDTFGPANLFDGGDGRPDGSGPYGKPTRGLAPHEGAVFVVAGSSGKVDTAPAFGHEAIHVAMAELGSVVLDVDDNRLDARFIDDGGALRDWFTLLKGCTSPCVERNCADGVDDEQDGATDCDDADCASVDGDGDGAPDCVDCAPGDATSHAPHLEVARLDVRKSASGVALLTWTPESSGGSATAYDVLTGRVTELQADGSFTRARCGWDDEPSTSVQDGVLLGASGDGAWYRGQEA